jgi:hypothetical protein
MALFNLVGLATVAWAGWREGCTLYARYTEHARQQEENLWLHTHCQQNDRLRAHTDACDRIRPLFDETPLAAALQPWLQHVVRWHTLAQDFVLAHHYAFVALWLLLFLILPQLLIAPLRKKDKRRPRTLV